MSMKRDDSSVRDIQVSELSPVIDKYSIQKLLDNSITNDHVSKILRLMRVCLAVCVLCSF